MNSRAASPRGFTGKANYEPDLPVCDIAPNQEDARALAAIYRAWGEPGTRHEGWRGWLSTEPLHQWDFVTTDRAGRVVKVIIRDPGGRHFGAPERRNRPLVIPGEFGGLSGLEELYLSGVGLTGDIPSSLGGLGKLRILHLQDNQLTGDIPGSFAGLEELRVLYLHDNQLSIQVPGTLFELAGRPHLRDVAVGSGQFASCVHRDVPVPWNLPVEVCP